MLIAQSVRFGFRRLLATPAFTGTILVTLSLAIAANVIVFSVVNGVLLRPLPIVEAGDVIVASETALGGRAGSKEVSYRDYLDWRTQTRSFESMAIVSSTNSGLVAELNGGPARFHAALVSASFFEVLEVRAVHGRTFTDAEDQRGAPRVLVLSDGFWRRQFGASAAAIGASMTIRGESFRVIGVMPPEFSYPSGAEAWTPVVPALTMMNERFKVDALEARHFGLHTVLARLRPGVSIDQARSELDVVSRRLPQSQHKNGPAVIVRGLLDEIYGATRTGALLLFAMVMFVTLIATANISSLVLARASSQESAFAVKSALGASRSQVTIEWTIEVAIVSLAAGVVGIFLGWIGLGPVLRLAPSSLLGLEHARVDVAVVAYAMTLCLLVTFLCGFLPAVGVTRSPVSSAQLRQRPGSVPGTMNGRKVLMALQVAVAAIVLTSAGLLLRSFEQLRREPLGFDPSRTLVLNVEPQTETRAEYLQAYRAVLERVSGLPDVQATGATSVAPLAAGRFGADTGYLLEGQRADRPQTWKNNTTLNFVAVTPGYFETMRVPLRAGRYFSDVDSEQASSVAIVSERTAQRIWPNDSALGKRISIASSVTASGRYPVQTVIGVVPDIPYRGIDEEHFDVYMPTSQTQHRVAYVVVRTSGDPLAAARSVIDAAKRAYPRSLVDSVRTQESLVADAFAPLRFTMALLVSMAVLCTIVAASGLYAVTAYVVSLNRSQLAVRMAIGASAGAVARMVLWQTSRPALAGLIVGLLVCLAFVHLMSPVLLQVPPRDVGAFVGAALLLGATSIVAACLAARRVLRIAPWLAMRSS